MKKILELDNLSINENGNLISVHIHHNNDTDEYEGEFNYKQTELTSGVKLIQIWYDDNCDKNHYMSNKQKEMFMSYKEYNTIFYYEVGGDGIYVDEYNNNLTHIKKNGGSERVDFIVKDSIKKTKNKKVIEYYYKHIKRKDVYNINFANDERTLLYIEENNMKKQSKTIENFKEYRDLPFSENIQYELFKRHTHCIVDNVETIVYTEKDILILMQILQEELTHIKNK